MILIGQLYDTDPSLLVVPQQNAAKEAVFLRWLFARRGNGSFMEITVAPCAPTGQTPQVASIEDYIQYSTIAKCDARVWKRDSFPWLPE